MKSFLFIIITISLLFISSLSFASMYYYYVPYYDMSGDVNTGIALTNMSNTTASVTLNYY